MADLGRTRRHSRRPCHFGWRRHATWLQDPLACHCRGFSLIEVLIVLALMGILAGVILPSSNPTIHDQLRSAARILATDLAYARSLAVTHGSQYEIAFEPDENRYVLRHSGTNASLDTLPDTPFRDPDDRPDEHTVNLADLPHIGAGVRIEGVVGSTDRTVEFGPLGQCTSSVPATIWLAAGEGTARRFITVSVNPVTGLGSIGSFGSAGPISVEPLELGPVAVGH